MKRTLLFLLADALLLLCAYSVFGQSLPEKPAPIKEQREFEIESMSLGASWMLDAISTKQRFSWCDAHYGTRIGYQQNCFESGGFFNGTRDTAKIMGSWAAVDIGGIILAYEWKRHVHGKLHGLWRVTLFIGTEEHTRAAIGNWTR
jgi:hypothetical protein